MDIAEIIKSRRTVRYFKQDPVEREVLLELVDLGRLAPSGGNGQPLRFVIVDDEDSVGKIFEQLAWAGHVTPRRTPPAGKRPIAYIAILLDNKFKMQVADSAGAVENILLGAWSKGIGSCWLGSIKRDEIANILGVPDSFYVQYVVALGYPAETPIAEDCSGESTKYYLDDGDVLHVPKRPLKKITHINKWSDDIEAK